MAIGNPISLTSNVATKTINVIATASQTSFTVTGGYRLNELSVFRNGVRLVNGRDFTARDGSIVTLLSAASEGDVLEFQVFDTFRVADAITPFDSAQTIAGDLSIVGVLSATTLGSVNFNLTSGIQTFHDVRVGGALTVAGSLTYEDTTNTNTVGLATFSGGMNISGVGATVTTLNVTGVSTFAGAVNFNGNLDLQDNDKILLGTGDDLQIYHNGTRSVIEDSGSGSLEILATNFVVKNAADNKNYIFGADGGAVTLYYDNAAKFATKTDGVDITGELQCDSLDVDGTTNFDDDVAFTGASYNASWDKSANSLKFADNAKIQVGSGEDLEIYHDGSNNYIAATSGSLFIRGSDLVLEDAAGNDYITCSDGGTGGTIALKHLGSTKFETKAYGAFLTGNLGFQDDGKLLLGASDDLQLYHTSGDSHITNSAGNLNLINSTNGWIRLQPKDGEEGVIVKFDGAVELYHNNSKKLETTSTGVTVTGTLNATTAVTQNGNALATNGKAIAMALIFG